MIRIDIKKNNVITNSAKFATLELANSWLSEEISNNSFGKPERWVREGQEDISNALENRLIIVQAAIPAVINSDGEIDIPEVVEISYMEYKLPAEYVVEQLDITNQIEQEKINKEAEEYLKSTDWYVLRMMDSGVAMPDGVQLLRQQARDRIVR